MPSALAHFAWFYQVLNKLNKRRLSYLKSIQVCLEIQVFLAVGCRVRCTCVERRGHRLYVSTCKSSVRYNCFSHRVIRVWNILPDCVNFYRAMHFSAKRGIAIACRLSVCPSVRLSVCLSVTLVNFDHIGWNSSKIISPLVSLGCSLFATPT